VSERAQKPAPGIANEEAIVLLLDDDELLRESLGSLLRSVQLRVETFSSPQELLQSPFASSDDNAGAMCLVLDIRLPGSSGLDLQTELAKANIAVPIIFITGHGDIPMTVRAMKAGAIDFLTKPFREQDLLDAVATALEQDRKRRADNRRRGELQSLYDTLTNREREIMAHVAEGLMNKQIAHLVGAAEITVKIHRGNAMRKMQARSLADFVRMAEILGIRKSDPENS
jgi:FixJ family two-component response regulator